MEDDPPLELRLVEVEEDWMVEEEAEGWREVEEVAYSCSNLWRSDWRNFYPAYY